MFLIIAFIKSFKIVMLVYFIDFLVKNTNLNHDSRIFLGVFF
jgi:hypothetical protein